MRNNVSLLTAIVLFAVTPAWGGFYEDLYRGLGYLATPSGSPVSASAAGGSSNGSRYGRLRIVPNDYGDGYRLELDRTFGTDTLGRIETFDIGPMELSLSGSIQSTVQYTSRLIPALNVNAYASNLQYVLTDKTGAQDFTLNGTIDVTNQLEINRFGFYTLDLEITQTNSQLTADGVIVDGTTDADYNVGPINIKGNVFIDMAAAALNGLGLDASGLEQLYPGSAIGQINDQINAYIDSQRAVLSAAVAADMADGELSNDGALAANDFVSGLMNTIDDPAAYGPTLNVPESSSLLLIGTLALVTLRRRF